MSAWGNLLRALGILAISGALLLLWSRGVRFYYRLRRPPPKLLRQRCSDGWKLGVHYRPAARRCFAEPVLLCHGVAANYLNFDFDPPFSLAHVLAERGFDCFSVDWRGSGASRRSPGRLPWASYSVDDHIRKDAPGVLGRPLARWTDRVGRYSGRSGRGATRSGDHRGAGVFQLRPPDPKSRAFRAERSLAVPLP